ncbi:radical SAM protein [Thermodesulfobacteriota bacterium]
MHFLKPEPAESIGLITNYRCTFRCKHCLYCSSPELKEEVEEASLLEIIDQIDRVLGNVLLHIGGGEPLIHFDLAKKIISNLAKKRIIVEYLETNGSYLLKNSLSRLQALKDAGLECILVSISPFHNEFIPAERIKKLVEDVISIFGREGLFPWHPGYLPFLEKVSQHEAVRLEDYFDHFSSSEIIYQLTSIMYIHPGGRGAPTLAKYLPCSHPEELLDKKCLENLSSPVHAHIDFQGNYLAGFCSGLRIGTEAGRDLSKLYKEGVRLSHYPLLEVLAKDGVRGLYEKARNSGFGARQEGYVSSCHLCLDLRRHLYFHAESFEELYPGFFYEDIDSLK